MSSYLILVSISAVIVLSTLVSIAQIGKPRATLTAGPTIVGIIINGLILWGIVTLAVRGGV